MDSSTTAVPVMMNSSSSSSSIDEVFNCGKYSANLNLVKVDSSDPPRPLLIWSPAAAGEFPVVIFLHGYLLQNSFYTQLLRHISSHGFVVVAPQLYSVAGPNANQDISATAEIIEWLSENLCNYLPENVRPNLKKLVLAGHSRGGKVAFALALGKSLSSPIKFSALIGVDPVDGMDKGQQTPPAVLTYAPNSMDLNGAPVLVIGSGLGDVRKNPFFPPCAPRGVNHKDFYNECCKPAHYFVAKDCGHLDVLDDETRGFRGRATYCLCKNGESRKPMRRFVGGVVVAFLRAYLEGDEESLVAIRRGYAKLPVVLQAVDSRV
ncbi:chlorophyllase-2 [Andrographis paniculata]|uniref:chlorophyllase-2 n=1 Tax=Andrographis paniculata TaxID=175694 RepID=UPI0021E76729|nr:chlorophyllase-2 [Andrographis paniculata]